MRNKTSKSKLYDKIDPIFHISSELSKLFINIWWQVALKNQGGTMAILLEFLLSYFLAHVRFILRGDYTISNANSII